MSTGFGLSDSIAEGTTPLKDTLNAKVELNVSWHVKMAEVALRMAIRFLEFHEKRYQMKGARAMLGGG